MSVVKRNGDGKRLGTTDVTETMGEDDCLKRLNYKVQRSHCKLQRSKIKQYLNEGRRHLPVIADDSVASGESSSLERSKNQSKWTIVRTMSLIS